MSTPMFVVLLTSKMARQFPVMLGAAALLLASCGSDAVEQTQVVTATPTAIATTPPLIVPTPSPLPQPTLAVPTATPMPAPTATLVPAPTVSAGLTGSAIDAESTVAPTNEPATPRNDAATAVPTVVPTEAPAAEPTVVPTEAATAVPTVVPTEAAAAEPTTDPAAESTAEPTPAPTVPVAPATGGVPLECYDPQVLVYRAFVEGIDELSFGGGKVTCTGAGTNRVAAERSYRHDTGLVVQRNGNFLFDPSGTGYIPYSGNIHYCIDGAPLSAPVRADSVPALLIVIDGEARSLASTGALGPSAFDNAGPRC